MTTTQPIQKGRRYRKLIFGLIGVGIVSLLVGMTVEQSLAGLVVYAVTVGGGVALTLYFEHLSSIPMQDERERELGERASSITFQLFGYLGLFGFVALLLLDATGQRALGSTAETLLYAYAVITLSWGGIYTVLRYRS
ncbi:DUF2178 domain-containing protein [Halorussus amylolyticus]|uniref:DUF2178 domain-containing protein n=1 Tax=Halorussus amylolyticus TaxID=1126242 RepID=UPI00138ED891|nr:DUF2178 domain-containing protein [Halorussus amylolyticus]